MGTQFLIETRTMKFLVVLALVAAAYAAPEAEANAEAEPWWYSNYGGWGGYRDASPYWNRGYAYASPYYRGYWKRDAEAVAEPEAKADAEAKPWWYSNYGGWGGYRYASPYWNRGTPTGTAGGGADGATGTGPTAMELTATSGGGNRLASSYSPKLHLYHANSFPLRAIFF